MRFFVSYRASRVIYYYLFPPTNAPVAKHIGESSVIGEFLKVIDNPVALLIILNMFNIHRVQLDVLRTAHLGYYIGKPDIP